MVAAEVMARCIDDVCVWGGAWRQAMRVAWRGIVFVPFDILKPISSGFLATELGRQSQWCVLHLICRTCKIQENKK